VAFSKSFLTTVYRTYFSCLAIFFYNRSIRLFYSQTYCDLRLAYWDSTCLLFVRFCLYLRSLSSFLMLSLILYNMTFELKLFYFVWRGLFGSCSSSIPCLKQLSWKSSKPWLNAFCYSSLREFAKLSFLLFMNLKNCCYLSILSSFFSSVLATTSATFFSNYFLISWVIFILDI